MRDKNLAGSCGIYCGACKFYLSLKKGIAEQKGHKRGCNGCQTRKTKCGMIKKTCSALRKAEIKYCFECKGTFPCQRLERMEKSYVKYSVSLIENLNDMKEKNIDKWLEEQAKFYKCPECGGEICVHDEECYDCGYKYNPNKK